MTLGYFTLKLVNSMTHIKHLKIIMSEYLGLLDCPLGVYEKSIGTLWSF